MHRTTLKICAVLAPFLLLTACVNNPPTIKVGVDRVTGNWVGPHGEKFTIAADRTFTANALDSKNLAAVRCPGKPSRGGWAFYAAVDEHTEIAEKTVKSGSWIGLSFAGAAENCHFDLVVVDAGKALCATDDADFSCGLDVKFTREP